MASNQSPEASEIRRRGRQRLIGAVAIALLLIVFVPMLLDSEPRSARDEPKLDIPAKDKAPPLPAPVPSTAEPRAAVAPPATTVPSPADTTAPAPAAIPAPAPKVAVVEPKQSAAAPAKAAAAPARNEGFAVQVGAFHDEAKLKQVRDKLAAAKVTTYTEPAGELTRLRVGPFPTREAAEKSAATVRKTVPDAKVVPLP